MKELRDYLVPCLLMLYSKKRPGRLWHGVPVWVDPGNAVYHVRVRLARRGATALTDPGLARQLLESVVLYALNDRWWPHLFLLMPDHWHALLTFSPEASMSRVIGDWKRWHTRVHHVVWQDGYFDHRLRHDESFEHAVAYITNNPVALGLCPMADDWPWRLTSADIRSAMEKPAASAAADA